MLVLSGAGVVTLAGTSPAFADDAVAGGQSASPADTLTPNQGNSGYDVSHYDINFAADFTTSTTNAAVGTSTINATTTIDAATTGAPLSLYSFDFQGSTGNLAAATLNVDTVTVNGTPATFSRIESSSLSSALVDNHKLIITPATPVSGAFTTVVTYHGAPVIHFDTDGSAEGWNNTTDGATFVNQPVGSMTLFPNNNTPRDTATYTWTIDVPTMLKTSTYAQAGGKPYPSAVAGNGELISKTPNGDGSRTTWVWNELNPMPSELSMVSIGRYDVYESDITLASGRTIHEWSFIDPAISTQNQNTTQVSRSQFKSLLDFYESKYGPYPGNSTGVVTDIVPSTINYALETKDRPFFPNSAGGSFYHEVMHQWWGDNTTPWDWNDITLNEGPATYAPFQFGYEGSGTTTTTTETAVYNTWNSTASTSNPTFTVPPAAMTLVSQLFGSQVYNKGAMSLEALRTSIGAANFETLMRTYQLTYGGLQTIGRKTATFQALAESISGRDLTAFFNSWWYTAGKPAWPAKYNLNLAGPITQVDPGDPASYTLTVRNTGKVATTAGSVVVTLDASDILDDATIGTLPPNVTQAGSTLTWAVPATALAATSTVTVPFTVNPDTTGNTLRGIARASTLGSTCIACTATWTIGTAPITTAVPTITGGTPTVGVPLTVDTTGARGVVKNGRGVVRRAWPVGTTFDYQWLLDGTPVPGATNATYTPAADVVGLAVSVRVTGSQGGSNPVTVTSGATPVGVRATQITGTLPTISGTPKIGSRLVLDRGTWEPGTVYTYQWRANNANISAANGGTGTSFTPTLATQVGQTIDVIVTGTKAGYTTLTKTTAATTAVVAGDPLSSTPTPVFPSTPTVGVLMVPNYGSWDDGVTTTFTWQANGANIGSATGGTYTPTAAQVGQTLTVTVTGTKLGIPAVVRVSAGAVIDPGTQTLQPTPSITGTPSPNIASTGVPGTWDSGTARTYKWYVDGVVIPGATATTYTPTVGQNGQVLTFEVTSTRAGYTTVIKTSAGKTIVRLTNQTAPSISGTPTVGAVLTADPGTWTPGGATFAYQWFANGVQISGASDQTFTPTEAEDGLHVAVRVVASMPGFESVSASSPSVRVTTALLSNTDAPVITGAPQPAQALSLSTGTWSLGGLTYSYQWYANGAAIRGATQATYVVPLIMIGKTVTGRVTASRPGSDAVVAPSSNSVLIVP